VHFYRIREFKSTEASGATRAGSVTDYTMLNACTAAPIRSIAQPSAVTWLELLPGGRAVAVATNGGITLVSWDGCGSRN
jgi:hypothetical protein